MDEESSDGRAAGITAADIRAEHRQALEALSEHQRRALKRLRDAQQRSCFNQRWPSDNLEDIFEEEAAQRRQAANVGNPASEDE